MTIPNSSNAMANILRLGGLKNAKGRRVMPGAEYIDQLAPEELDVGGIAPQLPNFANLLPNEPEMERGGELTPQSYDVRANVAPQEGIGQNEPEAPGLFSRLGQALGDYYKNYEISPEFYKKYNPTPGRFGENLSKLGENLGLENLAQGLESLGESAGLQGTVPESLETVAKGLEFAAEGATKTWPELQQQLNPPAPPAAAPSPGLLAREETLNQGIQNAMANPWQTSVYGAANEVTQNLPAQETFKAITGIDYEPQIAQQISEYEKAMQGVEDSFNGIQTQLDAQAEGIRQRILNNQSSESDKYYIGLALLMPLLIGGIFGKEAGLGALGGGAKGIAEVLGGRQKGIREDEAALLDIAKQQALTKEKQTNIGLEKAKLGPELRKNLPKQPNEHIIGMRETPEFIDPETGQTVKGVEIKPGLIAKPHFVANEKSKDNMVKAADELIPIKDYVEELSEVTDGIVEIASQLQDKTFLKKAWDSFWSGKDPTLIASVSPEVTFQGRKVNAGLELNTLIGFLSNSYAKAKDLGQLDRAAQAHMNKIVSNPIASFASPEDVINQAVNIRDLSQKGLMRSVKNKGFYPHFLIQDFQNKNEEFYGKLNRREEKKQIENIKQDLYRNESNYVK